MALTRIRTVVVLVVVMLATACDGRVPTAPTSPPPTSPPPTSPPPTAPPSTVTPTNPTLRVFEITGVVTDDTGAAVPGARVVIWNDNPAWSVRTDNAGRYTLSINAIGTIHHPGLDPAGTENAVAFGGVEAPGYGWHTRYVLGTSERLVENIRLRRPPKPIRSGESALLTIANDRVCGTDFWISSDGRGPGRESICETLSVIALKDGIMNIEAVAQPGATRPVLDVSGDGTSARGNPTSIPVAAGQEYHVGIALPWGSNQSFMVKTSM